MRVTYLRARDYLQNLNNKKPHKRNTSEVKFAEVGFTAKRIFVTIKTLALPILKNTLMRKWHLIQNQLSRSEISEKYTESPLKVAYHTSDSRFGCHSAPIGSPVICT